MDEIQDAEVSQAMVAQEPTRAIAKPMNRPVLTRDAIKIETEQRKLLGEFIKDNMVEGIDGDYGIIPGTSKRTLLKPGAEKLIQLFYCTPRYTITSKVENYETGLFSYHFKCEILNNDGHIVAEGVGFASTYESKFRWKTSERTCPKCGKATIIAGKEEYGGGWLCWAKKGGCNAKFTAEDRSITDQQTGQEQNPDIVDKINTVYKIAKKRAVVDAAISLARCSDLFTQDIEEYHTPENNGMKPGAMNTSQRARAAKEQEQPKEQPREQPNTQSRGEAIQQPNPPKEEPKQQKRQQYTRHICSKCGVEAVGRSKYPPRGQPNGTPGWHCYEASGGCKANFPFEAYGEQNAYEQPAGNDPSVPSAEDIAKMQADWLEWGSRVNDLPTFNMGVANSSADLKLLHKDLQMAAWNTIQAMATQKGWIWDKASKAFITK